MTNLPITRQTFLRAYVRYDPAQLYEALRLVRSNAVQETTAMVSRKGHTGLSKVTPDEASSLPASPAKVLEALGMSAKELPGILEPWQGVHRVHMASLPIGQLFGSTFASIESERAPAISLDQIDDLCAAFPLVLDDLADGNFHLPHERIAICAQWGRIRYVMLLEDAGDKAVNVRFCGMKSDTLLISTYPTVLNQASYMALLTVEKSDDPSLAPKSKAIMEAAQRGKFESGPPAAVQLTPYERGWSVVPTINSWDNQYRLIWIATWCLANLLAAVKQNTMVNGSKLRSANRADRRIYEQAHGEIPGPHADHIILFKRPAPQPASTVPDGPPREGSHDPKRPHARIAHWRTYKSGKRVAVRSSVIHRELLSDEQLLEIASSNAHII